MSNEMETSVSRGLGLTQEEVAKLGGFGVLLESVKLFGGKHPSLVAIQFAFVLPYILYLIVDQYAQETMINALFPDLPPSPSLSMVMKWGGEFPHLDLQKWLGILLLAFLVLLSFSLSLAILGAVFYAVGSIYNGRNVTFSEVGHAVPHLWWRLFVTAIVNFLLLVSVGVVFSIFIVVFKFTVPSGLLPLLALIFGVIFLIPLFITILIFEVANGVTCFEELYGVTAFRKGKHLLHNKWCSAVLLFILLAIPSLILDVLSESPVKLAHEFHWRWLVLSIFYVTFASYWAELICISWAVFYLSCSANFELHPPILHHDGVDQVEAGYQPIAPALP